MTQAHEPTLECRGLDAGYGSEMVIRGLSASFRGGTTTAVVGPSGSGKSTLLFALGLLLAPASGAVIVEGVDSGRCNDRRRSQIRATTMGFVFQNAHLDPARSVLHSVLEPCIYAGVDPRLYIARALTLLAKLDVRVPPGRRCDRLSGGQEQRVALCRAQLLEPRVVLADEPTGNLDPGNSDVVMKELRGMADGGAAVVIVTHSPEYGSACDEQIVLCVR